METPSGDSPTPPKPAKNDSSGEDRRRGPGSMALLVIAAMLLGGYYLFDSPSNHGSTVPYSYFYQQLESRNVRSVRIVGEVLTGRWIKIPEKPPEGFQGKLREDFNTVLLPLHAHDSDLVPALKKNNVELIDAEPTSVSRGAEILIWLAMPAVFLLLMWTMMRRSADPFSGGGMMGGFIKSPARRFQKSDKPVTFNDVAGLKSAKQDLQEVVDFLKNPKRFTRLGAKIPKGVLLLGPPGTGKTLLARATAGEAGVPFFSINGSEFIQMFVGVGATRVRDLFRTAREAAPCIVFIDEIDAVGRVRGAGVGGGHDEREQTLNQILSEMDGFEQTETVIVIAATNRNDVLDPALLRPGRFDRHVTVDRPARDGRLGILRVHTRQVPMAEDVDLESIARMTMGYSGAELEKLVNEAAIKAARDGKRHVEMSDFLYAHDLVIMGAPRDEQMDQQEKKLTAWHEAGHAVLGWFQEGVDAVQKVSIVPRGRTLGVTMFTPEKELYNVGEKHLRARLIMMLGGRAAEKLVFNEYSAGAQDDIDRATRLARKMVASWGMSEKIGPVSFRQSEEHPFLGKEMHSYREFSEETARLIDVEVQRIMHEAHDSAMQMLQKFRDQLDRLAAALLEFENVEQHQLIEILGPRPGASPAVSPA
ncbi:MAG: ATP-dependent zinc metalloprotease FtsH [Planctomyces sp.]|jgi:cell division protease FtsH